MPMDGWLLTILAVRYKCNRQAQRAPQRVDEAVETLTSCYQPNVLKQLVLIFVSIITVQSF